jgi:hypothetical protein
MSHFFRTVLCILFAVGLFVGPSYGQSEKKTPQTGGQRFYYNPLEQSIQWLRNEQIQKEIELTADQKTKLDKIRQDYYASTQQMYKELRNVDGGQRYEKLNEMRKKLSSDIESRVRKVLLKKQADRLRQIMLQMALLRQGSSRTLVQGEVAGELNLSEDQKAKLQEADNLARREMQEKIRKYQEKLRQEMLDKILSELDDNQRKKLKTMMGEEFQIKPPSHRPADSKAGT